MLYISLDLIIQLNIIIPIKRILNISKYNSNSSSLIFSSVNIIKGNNINKKDDLESLGYILLFLLKGELLLESIANDLNEKDKKEKYIN